MKYLDIVKYVKDNHVDWNTDIFDILKDYCSQYSSPHPSSSPIQELLIPNEFIAPDNGEYTIQDVINLFST
jgi:hypothetical protein